MKFLLILFCLSAHVNLTLCSGSSVTSLSSSSKSPVVKDLTNQQRSFEDHGSSTEHVPDDPEFTARPTTKRRRSRWSEDYANEDQRPGKRTRKAPKRTLQGKIGEGAFGHVYLMQESSEYGPDRLVAVKVIPRARLFGSTGSWQQNIFDLVVQEILTMNRLRNSEHFVCLDKVHEDQFNVYLTMEYAPFGSLDALIHTQGWPFSRSRLRKLTRDMCKGVEAMHKCAIFHGDLKPENFLICARGVVKIADFGGSLVLKEGEAVDCVCGTSTYWAPERFDGAQASFAIDIWALGVTIYEIATGELPFPDYGPDPATAFAELKIRVKTRSPGVLPIYQICPSLVGLILPMLVKDPKVRPNATTLLRYSWFRLGDLAREQTLHLDDILDRLKVDGTLSHFPAIQPPSAPPQSLRSNAQLEQAGVHVEQGSPLD